MKFSIAFLSSSFPARPKIQSEIWNISWTERAFKVKQKAFLSFLNDFQLPQVASDLARLVLGHAWVIIKKRARTSSKKARLRLFIPSFSISRAFRMLHHPILHVVLQVLTENKVFYFWNRALRAEISPGPESTTLYADHCLIENSTGLGNLCFLYPFSILSYRRNH